MKALALGLLAALAPAQEPARLLLEDVRAWLRADELPSPEDLRAVLAEADALAPDVELVHELSGVAYRLGRADRDAEARDLAEWVGANALRANDLGTLAWSQDWLGQEAWVRGELDVAAELLARAAETDGERAAPLERTKHLCDVARIRLTQGRFDEARAAIEGAEDVARSAGSSAAARAAAEVHGSLLFELGRHREALACCLADANGTEGAPAPRDAIQVRLDILAADVLADVGRLEAAATYARRAHETALAPEVRREAPLLHLEAKLSLGLLLGDLGRSDEALALLDEAAGEFERLGDARGAAWTDKNRGFVLAAAARWGESLPCFERAWRAGEALGVPVLAGLGALGVAEALVLGASGPTFDEARASAALESAARVADELHERQLAWRVAALRGRILLEHGEFEPALAELRRATLLIERWRRVLGASGLVEHALRQRSDPYRDAAFAAAHLGRMEEALAFAELLQARVLDELCARRDGPLPAPATDALDSLREKSARLEHRLPEAGAAERDELRAELARTEDELDAALLAGELARGRTLAAPMERVPLEQLGAGLAAQGLDVALVYLVGPEETLVLRLDAGTTARLRGQLLPVGQARLEHLIERLRVPIERLEAGELDLAHLGFDVAAARELHDALVRPLGLEDGARLALVTDGVLGAIPFELFVAGGEPGLVDFARPFAHFAGLRFLGDEHALASYGSVARLAHAPEARAGDAVVFLAPSALGLPHAAEEGAAVARALGGARLVPEATPEDVARELRGAARVHFIAHGGIDRERPAQGHLLLGGDVAGTSARLESWQAAELELDGALVVLSACHSGRGAWRAGAGLAGLVRGFQLGGAREVVASGWAVDDRVTRRFMELFYAELARGTDTPEALRAARVALRAETDPRGFSLAHPAFWAAWTVRR